VTGMRRLTQEQLDSFSYTVAELRRIALHHELVRALTAAGVELPPKQAA